MNTHVFWKARTCDSYPIQYCRPTFHGDTLKYRQHSKPDIVEAGDAVVRADPFLAARARIVVANVRTGRRHRAIVGVARRRRITLLDDLGCERVGLRRYDRDCIIIHCGVIANGEYCS